MSIAPDPGDPVPVRVDPTPLDIPFGANGTTTVRAVGFQLVLDGGGGWISEKSS